MFERSASEIRAIFLVLIIACFIPGAFAQPDVLFSSTYLGGMSDDGSSYLNTNLTLADDGSVYVTGSTKSYDFPLISGCCDSILSGGKDVFICKFNSDFTELLASTFLGGNNEEEPGDILISGDGYVYIIGYTKSNDFPVTPVSYDTSYGGTAAGPYDCGGDVFITKFDADLSIIIASTFFGGSGHDYSRGAAFDSYGNIVITGASNSTNLPATPGVFQPTRHTGGTFSEDSYVAILNNSLENLVACTYLGGNNFDFAEDISIINNIIYVAGWTASTNFPVSGNAAQRNYNGGSYDAFITALNLDLTGIQASTYLGGSSWDFNYCMIVDNEGTIFVAGHTASANFPFTADAFDTVYTGSSTPGLGDDSFITRVTADLDTFLASTYLGGNNWEIGLDMSFDSEENLYITGYTNSNLFPVTAGSFDEVWNGGYDVFISKFDRELSQLIASTFYGGMGEDNAYALINDPQGNVSFVGRTVSNNFPVYNWGYSGQYLGGEYDAFLAKIDDGLTTGYARINRNNTGNSSDIEFLSASPNPFNSSVVIEFELMIEDLVEISFYNIRGELVESASGYYNSPGVQRIVFTADKLCSGIYMVAVRCGNSTKTVKLVLIK